MKILITSLFIILSLNATAAEKPKESTKNFFLKVNPGYYLAVGVDYDYRGITQWDVNLPINIKKKPEKTKIWDLYPICHVPNDTPLEKEMYLVVGFNNVSGSSKDRLVGNYGRKVEITLGTSAVWKVDLSSKTSVRYGTGSLSSNYIISKNIPINLLGKSDAKFIYDGIKNGVSVFSLPLVRVFKTNDNIYGQQLKEVHALRIFMAKDINSIKSLVVARSGERFFDKKNISIRDMSGFSRSKK
ncbi:MAG: hypothetical protein HRT88_11410 [Lentisphaeraceae bacterium]|nr:hypothetical protein [Lentisphaeraceae bacterium]